LTVEQLLQFCAGQDRDEWMQKPFSWRRFTYATTGFCAVRVARFPDVEEGNFGRRTESFFTYNFPQAREVKFEPWPIVPPKMRDAIAIGGRYYAAHVCRLIGELPNARCGIFRGEKAAQVAEAEAAGYIWPLAFVAGEGRGAKAELSGLVMPLRPRAAKQ
jgi:hypothetical protein